MPRSTKPAVAGTSSDANAPLFISVKEAAHRLGVSQRSTYDLLNEGVIESRYVRSRRMVVVSSLNTVADRLPSERAV